MIWSRFMAAVDGITWLGRSGEEACPSWLPRLITPLKAKSRPVSRTGGFHSKSLIASASKEDFHTALSCSLVPFFSAWRFAATEKRWHRHQCTGHRVRGVDPVGWSCKAAVLFPKMCILWCHKGHWVSTHPTQCWPPFLLFPSKKSSSPSNLKTHHCFLIVYFTI